MGVRHAFMTRSLLDQQDKKSLRQISESLGFSSPLELEQVHGKDVLVVHADATIATVGGQQVDHGKYDGVLTSNKGLCLGIRSADCLPVLMYANGVQMIGALHCGWRSLSAGIVSEALGLAKKHFGVDSNHFVCALGPCISKKKFEVGIEVIEAFKDAFEKIFFSSRVRSFIGWGCFLRPNR